MSISEISSNRIDKLSDGFNRSSQAVRLFAILSPTCPPCIYGKEVVKEVFDEFSTDRLRGFVTWIPMLVGDNAEAARLQAETLRDPRLVQSWDPNGEIGALFAETLNLTRTAWDVYLLYEPAVRWEGNEPPEPTYWMHQLAPDSGADPRLCLNRRKFLAKVGRLLKDDR